MLTKIRDYIRKNYTPDGYDGAPEETADFPVIAKYILKEMEIETKYTSWSSNYGRFVNWCQGLPSIIDTAYYYDRSACSDMDFIWERPEGWHEGRMTEREAEQELTWMIWKELQKASDE